MTDSHAIDGYELAARFSYRVNALRYCGPEEGKNQFRRYLLGERTLELQQEISSSIKRFEALYPYLKLISEKTGRDLLDSKVVEAYWVGNELLNKFDKSDMNKLIDVLISRGLPKSLGEKLIQNMPAEGFPHHTFHVMYVGVGNVTGHVETTIQNMDNCRISIGKVLQTIDDHFIVETDTLLEKSGKLYLEHDTKTIVYDPELLPDIKEDDYIAIHWGFACMKLTNNQVEHLRKYTLKAIELRNSLI